MKTGLSARQVEEFWSGYERKCVKEELEWSEMRSGKKGVDGREKLGLFYSFLHMLFTWLTETWWSKTTMQGKRCIIFAVLSTFHLQWIRLSPSHSPRSPKCVVKGWSNHRYVVISQASERCGSIEKGNTNERGMVSYTPSRQVTKLSSPLLLISISSSPDYSRELKNERGEERRHKLRWTSERVKGMKKKVGLWEEITESLKRDEET